MAEVEDFFRLAKCQRVSASHRRLPHLRHVSMALAMLDAAQAEPAIRLRS